jgi:2-keto-3-deoxy-L-rhamnonate aldolase RhmA
MPLKLMYITNRIDVAKIAQNSGVDWIFIDLEINGKDERQGHLDTVISRHSIDDVRKVKGVLSKSKLLVRVNPIYYGSKDEINRVIEDGADIVMLPFFKTKEEVELFINYVDGRAKVCLLCETSEAVFNIDSILTLKGIDYIHIGLNDLSLSYNKQFMFELLVDGIVEMLCRKFKEKGIPFGFGGIAKIGNGVLPAEAILTEHYRLGSEMVILSRGFCDVTKIGDLNVISDIFNFDVKKIRTYEEILLKKEDLFFVNNYTQICQKIAMITKEIEMRVKNEQ